MGLLDSVLNTMKSYSSAERLKDTGRTGQIEDSGETLTSGLGFSLVIPSNPINWEKLGKVAVGSVASAFALGWTRTVDAWFTEVADVLSGPRTFLVGAWTDGQYPQLKPGTGLIPRVTGTFTTLIDQMWQPYAEMGMFGYLAAVATLLVSLWILARALEYARTAEVI